METQPLPKKGAEPPSFRPMSVVVGWIKMPLGTEVGLSLGDIVLDGDPASPALKGHSPLNFRPMFVVAKPLDGLRCHMVWR